MTQLQLEELQKVRREAFKAEMTRITKLEGITSAERRALHKACKEDYRRRNEELLKNRHSHRTQHFPTPGRFSASSLAYRQRSMRQIGS
ncbi:MAG: hypothetical protein IKN91_03225 [Paludibacteraceae bacterium]|nr:hypothetical protein [Paludibacteraceae bacterium]